MIQRRILLGISGENVKCRLIPTPLLVERGLAPSLQKDSY
jgi:hypothetical protein